METWLYKNIPIYGKRKKIEREKKRKINMGQDVTCCKA